MPRPPPGLWGTLRLVYREGVSRLSHGAQAPPRDVRDLDYRHVVSSAFRNVVRRVADPIGPSSASPNATASRSISHILPRPAPIAARNLSSSVAAGALARSPAPLRRGAHLGGAPSPPFRTGLPRTAQVGLQLHHRGFHAGLAGRQVLQNVVENAPLGVRATCQLEWRKREKAQRGVRRRWDDEKEHIAKPLKAEPLKKVSQLSPATQIDAASTVAASFDRFFPAAEAPVHPTSLLSIPLAYPAAATPYDWTDLLDPPHPPLHRPLLPRPVARALREHSDASTTHSLRLRSLFAAISKLPDDQVKDARVGGDGRLVIRLASNAAWSLIEGRENWLDVVDEAPADPNPSAGEGGDGADSRILRWREAVAVASPPSSAAASTVDFPTTASTTSEAGQRALDATWSDIAVHDRIASLFVMPSSPSFETADAVDQA